MYTKFQSEILKIGFDIGNVAHEGEGHKNI
jgi:hypothetical protein